ncbi:zinc-binding alcohol dehydrogenase family protein [Actinomadura sp. 3N508]|uniref:zinc-binding alcohol dehydrogenase family protein n=1 Tax=Actinomadura sp. 3N508 TaxID=3375153 RepID=UPI003797D2A9
MRVIQHDEFGAPSVLQNREADVPEPGPGELLVRCEAIGVDYAAVQRRHGVPIGFPVKLPSIPGGDVAGHVVASGEDVTNFPERIVTEVGGGAYAEYVVVDAEHVVPIPKGLDAATAVALLTPGQTAYHALTASGRLQPGETVLVNAASGGVGHLAVQLAKEMGAGTVIGTASSQAKLELVRSLGADHVIDYTRDDWTSQVQAVAGDGVDVILEVVGGKVLRQSAELLAPFGRMVVYGSASGDEIPPMDIDLRSMKTVTGFSIHAMLTRRAEAVGRGWNDLLAMVSKGSVQPLVNRTFALEEAAQAHTLMEERRHTGRVVLVP